MTLGQKPITLSAPGKKKGGSMRAMTVIVEVTCKTLCDVDELEELIEDVILEALSQDKEVEVKVTAEIKQKMQLP
tara:strand:+ start:393 stop:617 length:225 start_codon:yes stop_codon:yes gene_type:complete